jgi:hypothetical protein
LLLSAVLTGCATPGGFSFHNGNMGISAHSGVPMGVGYSGYGGQRMNPVVVHPGAVVHHRGFDSRPGVQVTPEYNQPTVCGQYGCQQRRGYYPPKVRNY